MRHVLILAAVISSAPATAQLAIVPAPMDTTKLATKSDVAAAQAIATSAIPPTCDVMPPADVVGGTAGTASACVRRQDAAPPATVMPAQAVTLADGTFSGSWPGTFAAAPTTALASAKTTAEPYICQVGVATTATFAGKCWRAVQTLTLPGLLAALPGAVLAPSAPATAGLTVMVTGRQ